MTLINAEDVLSKDIFSNYISDKIDDNYNMLSKFLKFLNFR